MARGKSVTVNDELGPELREHLQVLGLETVEQYRRWCAENGFGRKLNKHWKLRCQERFYAQQTAARERLKRKKHERRNQTDVLREICAGNLHERDVTQPHLQRLCLALRGKRGPVHERQVNRESLLELLAHVHRHRAKFFDDSSVIAHLGQGPGNTFIEALALVAAHARSWRRPLDDWKPRSHSASRQFASLLRHLFVEYDDMPLFFDAVWFMGRDKAAAGRRGWYLHVARGQNIRLCRIPLAFTKRMAHHFMRAPHDATINQALRWGQVLGLGGDERLARAIFATRLVEDFKHNEFWETVIRWFVAHPLLDRAHVGPIVDYLHNQRFVRERQPVAAGQGEDARPPQPNLTMKGRTPESLLRQVGVWHRCLAKDNTHQRSEWTSSGIEDFEFLEGSQTNGTLKLWTIRELLGGRALVAEGRRMKHCVATYADSCARGHCSIWTMEVETIDGRAKAVTIEVDHRVRQICQVRGKLNRLPTDKERNILRRWADRAGLRMAAYI